MASEIVVVGTSTGGLKALQTLLSGLAADFPLPVVIVQHRGSTAEIGLCEFLAQSSRLPISEPEDKEPVTPGRAYLAPRDYHLLIENRSFALSVDQAVAYARPSIDVLFECVADESHIWIATEHFFQTRSNRADHEPCRGHNRHPREPLALHLEQDDRAHSQRDCCEHLVGRSEQRP